jgi:hypothetical protein
MVPAYFANEQCDDYDRPRATWPRDDQQKATTNERKQGTEDADHQRTTTEAP